MNVRLFTTQTCPYCKLVKDFFQEKGVQYTEVDVAEDPAAANEMVKLSGQMGVPVVEIDGAIIVGWNKGALEDALKKKVKAAA
ncbi:glutathione S-transferase N-terminal domain-containing protein [Patescibacteria group bacterium]|nr:glutathione S-transferase N-terminal domain-containing protein [Patescibacteria group bacterium]MBU1034914.1 glutathione S-transferase N-terminal domain-containing protein [Patescibacteria group bacterium]MBU1629659.1 glutathione S-transferase N-terminal domain-containing protein [Patescibacteria group bacterium]MBU1908313.1 glutathione S-transferase N-terminal domain-containing protein [Patescibacteria group bacterium]